VFTYTCTVPAGSSITNTVFSLAQFSGTSYTYPAATSNSVLIVPDLTFQVTVADPSSQATVTNTATLDDSGTYITATASNTVTTDLFSLLGNMIWRDDDADGYQGGSEPGIPGVVVELYKNDGTRAYVLQQTTTTDDSGWYTFWVATTGDYQIQLPASNFASGGALEGHFQTEIYPSGGNQALPYSYTRTSTFSNELIADFGFYPTPTADDTVLGPDAVVDDGHVQVSWQTVNEVDILGFKLYRDGHSVNELIFMRAAEYAGNPMGYSYIYEDVAVDPLSTHVYWLEVVTTHGSYFLQPGLVNPYRIFLPISLH